MFKGKSKGIHFALATALVSGASIFVNKFAVDAVNNPLIFTTLKNTGVAIIMASFLLFSGKWKKIKELKRKDVFRLILIGIIGGSIPFYLFFKGLATIPAVNGAIIHKTLVLWVALLAFIFLKEKLPKKGWLAVIAIFSANILVGGFNGFQISAGEPFVLTATVLWTIETILAKKILPRIDPNLLIEARMGFGALVLLFISIFTKPQGFSEILNLSLESWMWIGITTTFLLFYVNFWYRGLKYAPATLATAVLTISTLITNILSAIFITHTPNTTLLIQLLLTSAGIYIIYRIEKKASPLRHSCMSRSTRVGKIYLQSTKQNTNRSSKNI